VTRVAHRRAVQNPGRGTFLRVDAVAESVVGGDAGASSAASVDVLDIGK